MGSTLMIRNLDDEVKARLRVRAAMHGHSMAAEVRQILADAVNDGLPAPRRTLLDVFAQMPDTSDIDLPLPQRTVEPPRDIGWD